MLFRPLVHVLIGTALQLGLIGLAAAQTPPATPAGLPAGSEIRTGIFRGAAVTYAIVNGKAVLHGDMLLDHVDTAPTGTPRIHPAVGIAYGSYFWPKVGGVAQIPYIVTNTGDNLSAALTQFNATFGGLIQFVPRTTETDYVNFNFDPSDLNGACESNVGHIGGEQSVGGAVNCSTATILHEMGHTLGLYHEMSRPDRNTYVKVLTTNMIKGSEANFDILIDNFQETGLYDYASIMHYPAFVLSRNGGPTLESIPAGMTLSNDSGYSAADLDGINRLYGAIPASVTVTTNPGGLHVIVDGTTYTAPHSFAWTLNSTHTLALPAGAQSVSGNTYTYGRWNDSTKASHSIKITPGIGTLASPATAPATTVYSANFIQLVQYQPAVWPTGAGTVSASPAAKSYAGAPGSYYVARQAVKLTASPNAGYHFFWWVNTSSPWSINPKTELGPGAITADFSSQPITTITTNPTGIAVLVDGQWWYGPANFASDYFSGWTAGSAHTIEIPSPQYPYSVNTRYLFSKWSDKGAASHSITVPAAASTITATVTPQYVPIAYAEPSCAATVTLAPAAPAGDGFYNKGTKVTVTATAQAGWTLTGWLDDLSGTTDPKLLTVNDEELAVADYNTIGTPLDVTSLTPPTVPSGTNGKTITIGGTGFASSSYVYFNNIYHASQYVSSTAMTVALTAGDLASPGAFPIGVGNYTSSPPCGAYVPQTFFVTQ